MSSGPRLLDETEPRKVVKSPIFSTLLYGRHHWKAVQMLEEEGLNPWIDDSLCVNLIMHRYGAAILQAEATKPGKIANISTDTVKKQDVFRGKDSADELSPSVLIAVQHLCFRYLDEGCCREHDILQVPSDAKLRHIHSLCLVSEMHT